LSLRYLLLLVVVVVVVATERGDEVKRRGLRKRSGVGEFVAVIIIIIVADVFVGGDRDEGELGPDQQTTEKDMVRFCEYANLKTTTSRYSLGTLD
jgi:hypothetical protein